MSKVFVDVGVSLDGQIAGPNRRPGNPLGDGGIPIHQWMFETRAFWERSGKPGGKPSPDDARIRTVFERAGAYVMGRRMFDEGEVAWPEDGADAIRQDLRAGAVDEMTLHVAPMLVGDGLHLFEGLKPDDPRFEQEHVASSPLATHIAYRVIR